MDQDGRATAPRERARRRALARELTVLVFRCLEMSPSRRVSSDALAEGAAACVATVETGTYGSEARADEAWRRHAARPACRDSRTCRRSKRRARCLPWIVRLTLITSTGQATHHRSRSRSHPKRRATSVLPSMDRSEPRSPPSGIGVLLCDSRAESRYGALCTASLLRDKSPARFCRNEVPRLPIPLHSTAFCRFHCILHS